MPQPATTILTAKDLLGAALGQIPSGLFILTLRHGQQRTGMLLSWVQQCSFHPPRLSLAIQPKRQLSDWLETGGEFTVNVLDESQTDMIGHFGRGFGPGEPAFTDIDIERPSHGGPVLTEAHAFLLCRVFARHAAGDHDLLIADIESGKVLSEGHPMVHVRKSGLHY